MRTACDDSAFPVAGVCGGLSTREIFAMAAMQGLCARSDTCWTSQDIAAKAVIHADALIEALNKKDAA